MFGLYKKAPNTETTPTVPTRGFFHVRQTRKPIATSPGAGNVAYESLALPLFTPIGTGVQRVREMLATAKPLVALQSVPRTGMPTDTGTMRTQPLFDPNSGAYLAGFSGVNNEPYNGGGL